MTVSLTATPSGRTVEPVTTRRLDRMPALDGLRAVAILLVVIGHAHPAFEGGIIGVDVFFVLSGFLITALVAEEIQAGTFSRRHFYARRAIRLIPALLVTVIVFTPIALLVEGNGLVWWGAAAALLYLTPLGSATVFYHTWTLALEEWFYLLWPIALARMSRDGLTLRQSAVLVGGLGLAMQSAMLIHAEFFLCRAAGLLIGCAAGLWWCDGGSARRPKSTAVLGLGVILAGAALSPYVIPAVPFWLAAWGAVLVVVGIASGARNSVLPMFERKPMVVLGVVSYEWYLLHFPMLVLADEVWGPRAYAVVVPLSLALALALHYVLFPIQVRLRERLERAPVVA